MGNPGGGGYSPILTHRECPAGMTRFLGENFLKAGMKSSRKNVNPGSWVNLYCKIGILIGSNCVSRSIIR